MTDVVVMGEALVEFALGSALHAGARLTLGFSGDALNCAAAAAAAGAETTLLGRVADDDLGDALVNFVSSLGVDVSAVRKVAAPQGSYVVRADSTGQRQFTYLRQGSAGSTLDESDLEALDRLGPSVVVASGIGCAISASAESAIRGAADWARSKGRMFVYDPNYRARLTTTLRARAALRHLAPLSTVVTPSCPTETTALLDTADPAVAARAIRAMGAASVVVTCGADGVVIADSADVRTVPAFPAASVVDQTGAGDSFTGTLAALLSLGADLDAAVAGGQQAAAVAVGALGGLGHRGPSAR